MITLGLVGYASSALVRLVGNRLMAWRTGAAGVQRGGGCASTGSARPTARARRVVALEDVLARGRAGRAPGPRRSVGLRQDDAAARGRRLPPDLHRARSGSTAGSCAVPASRRPSPGPTGWWCSRARPCSLADGARRTSPTASRCSAGSARDARALGRRRARRGRPGRLEERYPGRALERVAAPRRARAGAGHRAARAAARRAVPGHGLDHRLGHAGGPARALRPGRRDRPVHHPRHRGGRVPGQPGLGHEHAAGPDQAHRRHRPAPAARRRRADLARSSGLVAEISASVRDEARAAFELGERGLGASAVAVRRGQPAASSRCSCGRSARGSTAGPGSRRPVPGPPARRPPRWWPRSATWSPRTATGTAGSSRFERVAWGFGCRHPARRAARPAAGHEPDGQAGRSSRSSRPCGRSRRSPGCRCRSSSGRPRSSRSPS